MRRENDGKKNCRCILRSMGKLLTELSLLGFSSRWPLHKRPFCTKKFLQDRYEIIGIWNKNHRDQGKVKRNRTSLHFSKPWSSGNMILRFYPDLRNGINSVVMPSFS